jgi:peptidoglycan hydrolase CwlO-like protein
MANPIFNEAFFSNVMKTAAVTVAVSLVGICGNAILATHDQGKVMTWHTTAIQKLQDGQTAQAKTLQDVDVGIVRLEGKIDTLNQKIDDAQHREVADEPEPHHWVASK